MKNYVVTLGIGLLALLTVGRAAEQREIRPFMIMPAQTVDGAKIPGKEFHLPKHLLRLQVTFKMELEKKLDEDLDPADSTVQQFYLATLKVKPTGATMATVRTRDENHRYFMALGQLKSFLRDKKVSATFSEDGFFLGTEMSFEDKTLPILAEIAKVAIAVAAFGPTAPAAKLTPEQLQRERENATQARRLKGYTERVRLGLAKGQTDLERELNAQPPDWERVGKLSATLEALHGELASAVAARNALLSTGAKSEVVSFTSDHEIDLAQGFMITPNWDRIPEWQEFTARMSETFHSSAAAKLGDALREAFIVLEFPGFESPDRLKPKPLAVDFPYEGVLIRQPRLARATFNIRVGEGAGRRSEVLGRTEGASLKFGQFGQLVPVPVRSFVLMKGEFSVSLNADGDIVKMGSGTSAAGSNLAAGASAALAAYQAHEKSKVSGGFETELLNAGAARMKAVIDYAKIKKDYDELTTPPEN